MRKAQLSWPAILIVFLVFLVLMLLFEGQLRDLIASQTAKNDCKASVYKHAAAHLKMFDFSTEIVCPPENKTVTGNEDEQKLQIAQLMYNCWDQYGKGKLDLFKEDDVYCAICSWIRFDQKNSRIADFDKYLYTTNVPGKDYSFMDFLNGYETPRARELVGSIVQQPASDTTIFTDKKYSVIFVYARGDDTIRQFFSNFVSSKSFPFIIAGGMLYVAGGALTATGVGGLPGLALFALGKLVMVAGTTTTAGALTITSVDTWLKTDKAQHAAFVALREYSSSELQQLGCKTLPVKNK